VRKIHMKNTLDAGLNSANPFPHQGPQKPFKCSACDASFTTVHSRERHLAAIHVKQTFMCPHCPGTVYSARDLAQHNVQFHRPVITCQVCAKCVVGTREYKMHMKTHTKKK
jgi:hypothetical protein